MDETVEYFDAEDRPFNDEVSQKETSENVTSVVEFNEKDNLTPLSNSPEVTLKYFGKNDVYTVLRSSMLVLLLMNMLLILLGNGTSISLEYYGKNRPNSAFLKLSLIWRESNENLELKLFSSCCRASNLVPETDDIYTSYFRSIKGLKDNVNPDNVNHVNANDRQKTMMNKKPVDKMGLKYMVFNTVRMAKEDDLIKASNDIDEVQDNEDENFCDWKKGKINIDHMDKPTKCVKVAKAIDKNPKEMFDDTIKIDDESPVDTKGHSQMKNSSNLLYIVRYYQVLESV